MFNPFHMLMYPMTGALIGGGLVLAAAAMLFLSSAVLMWLWNLTLPQVFQVRSLTYWQAFRLNLIASILFGGTRLGFGG